MLHYVTISILNEEVFTIMSIERSEMSILFGIQTAAVFVPDL